MRNTLVLMALLALVCTSALAAGPTNPAQSVPPIAAQVQAMRINETIRLKVEKSSDLAGAGLKNVKPGDEVELKKVSADTVEVKHMPSGQTGVLPPSVVCDTK